MAIERTDFHCKAGAVAKKYHRPNLQPFRAKRLAYRCSQNEASVCARAQDFYAVHKERPFYADLVAFMTSGPVMIQVLEGENAVAKNRELMGQPIPKMPLRARFALICRISEHQCGTRFRQFGKCGNRNSLFLQPKRNLSALKVGE